MSRLWLRLPGRAFLAAMLAGSGLITAYSLEYFDFERVPEFVVERLPERFASVWLCALRVHVAAALLSLPLCLVLSTRWLQKRPAWHRRLGRVAGALVLVALVPSGAVLALHAKGGPVVTAGFLLSGAIVAGCMVRGVVAARGHAVATHRRAMRHVLGQMSVAVTSRALLLGFDAVGVGPDTAYVVALWGPVLASAAVAESLSLPPGSVAASATHVLKGIAREIVSLARLVGSRTVARAFIRHGR
jgi:uncharacterized membrane protein